MTDTNKTSGVNVLATLRAAEIELADRGASKLALRVFSDAHTAVAALIERNAELEAQTPSALREKLRSCEEALQTVEAERDALAAEVKSLRDVLREFQDGRRISNPHTRQVARDIEQQAIARASAATGED